MDLPTWPWYLNLGCSQAEMWGWVDMDFTHQRSTHIMAQWDGLICSISAQLRNILEENSIITDDAGGWIVAAPQPKLLNLLWLCVGGGEGCRRNTRKNGADEQIDFGQMSTHWVLANKLCWTDETTFVICSMLEFELCATDFKYIFFQRFLSDQNA